MATYTELPIVTTDSVESVDLIAELPAVGIVAGSIRYVAQDQNLYLYNGTTWNIV